MEPPSPPQVLDSLFKIFPTFEDWWNAGTPGASDEPLGYEGIMSDLLTFLATTHRQSFSEQQVRRLSDWLNDTVLRPDALGTAISESFLEPARDVSVWRVLAPFLSRQAKAKSFPS